MVTKGRGMAVEGKDKLGVWEAGRDQAMQALVNHGKESGFIPRAK